MSDQPDSRQDDDLLAFKDERPTPDGPLPMPIVEPVQTLLPPWQRRPRRADGGGISWPRLLFGIALAAGVAALGYYIYWRYQRDSRQLQERPALSGPPANQPRNLGKMDPLEAGLIRGQDFLDHGRFLDALEVYRQTQVGRPEPPAALHVGMARALLGLGRLDEAADSVNVAFQSGPEHADPSAYAARADVRLARGEFEAALADCDRAIALGDSGLPAQMRRARCLAALGRADQAEELIARLRAERPDDALSLLERAEVLSPWLNRHADAVTDLNYALLRSESLSMPNRARARLARGLAFLAQGKLDDAAIDLEAAVATRDSDVAALSAYADCLARTDRFDQAVGVLTRLLELCPADPSFRARLREVQTRTARPGD